MKYTQFKAFEKHLESSKSFQCAPLYCIFCKDSAEKQWAIDELKKHFFEKKPTLNYQSYACEQSFLSDLEMPSFFLDEQLLLYSPQEKPSKTFNERFQKALTSLRPTVSIIFASESLSGTTQLYKTMEKLGVILEIGDEKPWEKEKALAEWLLEQATRVQKTLSPESVNALVRGTARNYALLAKEWEKLLLYVGERVEILHQDIRSISTLLPEDATWALGEAILNKDFKTASFQIKYSIENGHALITLLRQLRHQFMTAIQILSYHETRQEEALLKKFPYLKGQMLQKQISTAARFGQEELQQALLVLDQCEFKAKDNWNDPVTLFTYLLTKIT